MPRLSKVYSAFLTRTIVQVENALYEVLPTAHYFRFNDKKLLCLSYSKQHHNKRIFKFISNKVFVILEKRKEKILLIETSTVIEPEFGVLFRVPHIDLLTLVFG